ncbi:MAG: argininosuccinate synthase-related protein [Phycisphaerales bacterium]
MRLPTTKTIDSLESLATAIHSGVRPLLLFSGGLDGAYLLSTLRTHGIIALTVGLGGDAPIESAKAACSAFGIRHIHIDARARFAVDFVGPAISAQAAYAGGHPICASLSRPLLAQIATEVAGQCDPICNAIIHTSNPSQNSLRRFNGALRDLGFPGVFGSPFACSHVSRADKCRALAKAGLPEFVTRAVSMDVNLWGREFEFGVLDDPENVTVPPHLYLWTRGPHVSPKPVRLRVTIQRGVPVAIDNAPLELVELVDRLNVLVGGYGLGRYIGLEELASGAKVQEVREMPAAFCLFDAYKRLESATVPYSCIREKMHMEQIWVQEAVEGRWFGPLRMAAEAFIASVRDAVTGIVEYELSPGAMTPRSVVARTPLYVRDRSLLE